MTELIFTLLKQIYYHGIVTYLAPAGVGSFVKPHVCRYDLPHGLNKMLREEASREIFRENLKGKLSYYYSTAWIHIYFHYMKYNHEIYFVITAKLRDADRSLLRSGKSFEGWKWQ